MSDGGAISQSEIDALLSGVDANSLNPLDAGEGVDVASLKEFASSLKEPLLKKINDTFSASFSMDEPTTEIVSRDDFLEKLGETVIEVENSYSSGISGKHIYYVPTEFSQKLAQSSGAQEISLPSLEEVIASHTENENLELKKTGKVEDIASSSVSAANKPKATIEAPDGNFVLISYPMKSGDETFNLLEVIEEEAAVKISSFLRKKEEKPKEVSNSIREEQKIQNQMTENIMANQMTGNGGQQIPGGIPNVQNLQFPNLQGQNMNSEPGNIALIMDVFMEVTVELGRTKKTIKDILSMGEGTIIELDKLAGEAVDILVNHKPIAKGEVVVIDENFGVRVTEILSPIERVTELR